jgi:polyisoprenyl-phosphate glycosyltransferase
MGATVAIGPRLTVLICVFNQRPNLSPLITELGAVLDPWLGSDCEILFVDDGSSDGSADLLDEFAARDRRVRVIHFSRNFGQHAAIAAGMVYARGQALVLMDADLQDPPAAIPALYAEYAKGAQVVFSLRRERKDSFLRRVSARVFFRMLAHLLKQRVPSNIGTFRLLAAPVVSAFNRLGERSRVTGPLNHWLGFRTAYVTVEHHPRHQGRSKYGLRGLMRLSLWAVTAFSYFPLRLATLAGLAITGTGAAYAAYTVAYRLFIGGVYPGFSALALLMVLLSGAQMVVLGILGEYVGRIYTEVQDRPLFLIERAVNFEPDERLDLEPGHRSWDTRP